MSTDAPPQMMPASLNRLGPARIQVTTGSGRPVRFSGRYMVLKAGKRLRFVIDPPPPEPGQPACQIHVTTTEALPQVVQLTTAQEGGKQRYYFEVRGHSLGSYPIPNAGDITITISNGLAKPLTMHIPVAVMPSNGRVVIWALFGLVLPSLSYRYYRVVAESLDPMDAVLGMATEWKTLLYGAVVCVASLVAIRIGSISYMSMFTSVSEGE